jgi:DNA-binding transcriptional MerR regulator
MDNLTIGQVAKKAGVNIQTIRYYERRNLLPEPSRGESGYRHYEEETVRHIRFIRNAKELGFSLKEIGRVVRAEIRRNVIEVVFLVTMGGDIRGRLRDILFEWDPAMSYVIEERQLSE